MTSIMKPISLGEISKLTTKRLLAYLDRLRACEESVTHSDIGSFVPDPEDPNSIVHHVSQSDIDREVDPNTIRFKTDPRWIELYEAIKAELANREHVSRGDKPTKNG